MEDSRLLQGFRVMGEIQSTIASAKTLDEALQGGLKTMVRAGGVEAAAIWYMDSKGDGNLHPYFWIGPDDLTSCSRAAGEGAVGRVFKKGKAERALDFASMPDPYTAKDFPSLDIKSMLCVPFSSLREEEVGCIQFVNRTDGCLFTDEDGDIVEFMADVAALALKENQQIQEPWNPGTPIIECHDIKREFTNGDVVTKVLKGVNLNVYDGEFLVLLGESGCGKSTLLNVIGGMDQASSGSFTFCGREMSTASQKELTEYRRANIGFIFQSYNLMPNLTALQNLRLIAELVDDPLDCEEALKMVGLADRANNYPSQMSGGQQQRVSIARALVKKPKLIFADEPTAALDYTTSIEVLKVMEDIVKAGTTMVMVTHNEEITRMADRVVRMRGGKTYEVTVNRHPAHATDLVW